jgi:hypothetical protein
MASTRFWRCSSPGSIAGRVLIADSSRTEKTRVPSGSRSSSSSAAVLRAEGEGVLAESDHVAWSQAAPLAHRLAVEQRAVLAVEVAHPVAVAPVLDRGVVAREPLVGEEDVALARAADRDPRLGERVALAGAAGGLDGDLGHGGEPRDSTSGAGRARLRALARRLGIEPRDGRRSGGGGHGGGRLPDGDLRGGPRVPDPDRGLHGPPRGRLRLRHPRLVLLALAVQLNVWRVLGASGRRAPELASAVVPGLGPVLAGLVTVGGLVFNVGNVAGCGLGLAVFGVPEGRGRRCRRLVVACSSPRRGRGRGWTGRPGARPPHDPAHRRGHARVAARRGRGAALGGLARAGSRCCRS